MTDEHESFVKHQYLVLKVMRSLQKFFDSRFYFQVKEGFVWNEKKCRWEMEFWYFKTFQ